MRNLWSAEASPAMSSSAVAEHRVRSSCSYACKGCLSDYVRNLLTMFTGKDLDPLSGAEHDMVPDRKVNQVRIEAQLLHRVGSEPFVLGGHSHRVFAAFFRR